MKKQIHHVLAKTPLLIRVVSLYVVAASIAGLFWPTLQPTKTAYGEVASISLAQTLPQAQETISGRPGRIELPRIGLVRDVVNGNYDSQTHEWTLTDDKVQYAVMTAPVNNKGDQTLIYGHNTSAVLEPVRDVELGDILMITTTDGHVFTYVYSHDRVVDPADTSVLKEHPDKPRVVLMTCEGVWSQTRRLLYFDLKAAQ